MLIQNKTIFVLEYKDKGISVYNNDEKFDLPRNKILKAKY